MLAQAAMVPSSLTPIRDSFSLGFRDSTRQLIKVGLFYLVSLA